ncbi:polymer-forming cytoskeletal protein [Idiomarina seosinensis]|uniref:DUF6701 domain-containing protein n=1 Tax=Idiomarina seosinensis TaxID=281739 RepID=UPI0038507F7F
MRFFKAALVIIGLLSATQAVAEAFDTDKTLPPECTQKGQDPVLCPNGLTLTANDSVTASKVDTIIVTGQASLGGATITGVNVIVNNGSLTTSNDFSTDSNLDVSGGSISFGQNNNVGGDITADSISHSGGTANTYSGDITVTSSYVGASGNTISGNLTGGAVTTANNETITGSISGTDVFLGYRSSVGSSIIANSLETDAQVDISSFVRADSVIIGSESTVQGSITGTDSVVLKPSNGTFNGNIASTGTVDIGSSNTVNGNVNGANIYLRASGTEVVGDVVANDDLVIESGSGIEGSAAADIIEMQDSNAYITENAVADTEIDIGWDGSIGGSASASTIINNSGDENAVAGDIYCDDSSSTVDPNDAFTCQSGSGPSGPDGSDPSSGATCEELAALSYLGIVGLSQFESGSGSSINDNEIQDKEGNTPTPEGIIDTVDLPYPPLNPETFPAFPTSPDYGSVTNGKDLPPGTYDTIYTDTPNDYSSTAGGTYYIDTLSFSTNNNYLEIAPGTYYIRNLNLANNSSVNIVPSGLVTIYIENGVTGGNDISFNSDGLTSNLMVYLYENADFIVGNYCNSGKNCPEFTFNGNIYSPYQSVDIEFGQNTNYQGSALTQGTVTFGNNTEITYSPQDQEEALIAQGCDPAILNGVDHYRLTFPASTVSCLAAEVEITACADDNCNSTATSDVTATVESSDVNSQWQSSSEASASANLVDFSFSDGSATTALRLTTGGISTLSITTASPAASAPLECYDNAGISNSSCSIEFKTAGLVITDTDGISPIPGKFAGTPFDTLLRAVETNTTTGACEARVEGTQTVQLGVEAVNPTAPVSGQSYQVNSTVVDLYSLGNSAASTSLTLNFNSDGAAVLNNVYSDVGQLRMNAELQLPADPATGDPEILLTGSSLNNYVVKPHTLTLTPLTDSDDPRPATFESGDGYRAAGEAFNAIIQSFNADGNSTPNFGNEQTNDVTRVRVQFDSMAHPLPAAPDSDASKLLNAEAFSLTNPGTNTGTFKTSSLAWAEAGTVNLRAQLGGNGEPLNDYLGAGDALSRPVTPVGRFYPHRFILDSSRLDNTCSAGSFSYMGEPGIGVNYTVRAVNTQGSVTQNYANSGGINYGNGNTAELTTVVANETPADTTADNFSSRWALATGDTWQLGELVFTATDGLFSRRADLQPDGPYENFKVGLQVNTELDNRDFASADKTLATHSGDAVPLADTLALRYGRTVLANISGPDGVDLNIIMENQYFNSAGEFVTHSDDSCFDYDVANFDAGSQSIVAGPTTAEFSNGELQTDAALFEAPTSPATGFFPFSYDTKSWLEFDWDGDGTTEDPAATASFGFYRGNDRIIYWLERWQ